MAVVCQCYHYQMVSHLEVVSEQAAPTIKALKKHITVNEPSLTVVHKIQAKRHTTEWH